jgi:DNA-3-methyladenine glycosylase I
MSASGAVRGDDGRLRCPWGMSTPDYVRYHDEEWGRPLSTNNAMFERLTLEGFQSGLSWLIILRKRPAFRAAFANFSIRKVADFEETDVERLLADAGIVRNRQKIEATIANARAVLALRKSGTSFPELVLAHRPPERPAPASFADVPATTPESKALAKTLRAAGFRFVGPTTAYALQQAAGHVNDHLAGCPVRGDVEAARALAFA